MKGKKLLAGILSAAAVLAAMAFPAFAENKADWESNSDANVVVYGAGENGADVYTKTLYEALNAVYMSSPTDTVTVECRAGADVGALTHGHVADSIVIIGNGAYISDGERDLELGEYTFDRSVGIYPPKSNPNAYKRIDGVSEITKNISVKVTELDGIAAWGTRRNDYTVDLTFTDCKNMQRVYINGNVGTTNITLSGCTFDGSADEACKKAGDTAVYSCNKGSLSITDCSFTAIALPVNINNKSDGQRTISIKNTKFTDCATTDNKQASDWKAFAAPIRLVTSGSDTTTTDATIENVEFVYSDSISSVGNGDILMGTREAGKTSYPNITLNVSKTDAEVQTQYPGITSAATEIVNAGNSKTIVMSSDSSAAGWTVMTDAGYYEQGDEKLGVMRFSFNAPDSVGTITKAGIKYISSADGNVGEAKGVEGSISGNAFYGDINKIPEGKSGKYYAKAYVETEGGGTVWSQLIDCAVNWAQKFTAYPGGEN